MLILPGTNKKTRRFYAMRKRQASQGRGESYNRFPYYVCQRAKKYFLLILFPLFPLIRPNPRRFGPVIPLGVPLVMGDFHRFFTPVLPMLHLRPVRWWHRGIGSVSCRDHPRRKRKSVSGRRWISAHLPAALARNPPCVFMRIPSHIIIIAFHDRHSLSIYYLICMRNKVVLCKNLPSSRPWIMRFIGEMKAFKIF